MLNWSQTAIIFEKHPKSILSFYIDLIIIIYYFNTSICLFACLKVCGSVANCFQSKVAKTGS